MYYFQKKTKILIDEKNRIYFEILLDIVNEDKDDKKKIVVYFRIA